MLLDIVNLIQCFSFGVIMQCLSLPHTLQCLNTVAQGFPSSLGKWPQMDIISYELNTKWILLRILINTALLGISSFILSLSNSKKDICFITLTARRQILTKWKLRTAPFSYPLLNRCLLIPQIREKKKKKDFPLQINSGKYGARSLNILRSSISHVTLVRYLG